METTIGEEIKNRKAGTKGLLNSRHQITQSSFKISYASYQDIEADEA